MESRSPRRDPAKSQQNQPEAALNKKVKGLIQRLGEAIHETVSESEHVAGVVRDIREQGFDVMLVLEATIGLNELREPETAAGEGEKSAAGSEGTFTPHDLHFLKSLRISIAESADGQGSEPGTSGQGDGAGSPDAP